jgi:hypothetical protein
MERDRLVVEGTVEVDRSNMTVFVEGEGLATVLLERFGADKPDRFLRLGNLRITVERLRPDSREPRF